MESFLARPGSDKVQDSPTRSDLRLTPPAAINARDRRKPEPRSCSGMKHQCVIGLSLPSYFDYRRRVN
jgi:hypothetical protein